MKGSYYSIVADHLRVVRVYAYVFMSMLMGEWCGCMPYVFMSMLMGEWCGCVHMYLCQCWWESGVGVCICIYVIVDGRVLWVYAYVFMSMWSMSVYCILWKCIEISGHDSMLMTAVKEWSGS